MAETYCGKNCADYNDRLTISCPGCRVGPGRSLGGECEIARCCREKGHESCDTCINRERCGKFFQRDTMAEYRNKKLEREQETLRTRARKAAFLGERTQWLFWLTIFANVIGLVTIEQVVDLIPAVKVPGMLLSAASSIGYCLILLKMSDEEPRFRTAAYCALATMAVNFLFQTLLGMETLPLLVSVPTIVVGMIGEYNEFHGFGDALAGIDITLSDKWYGLWKWYLGCYGALFGSIFLMVLIPFLGVVAMFAAAIGILVVAIVQIVYLYRSFRAFQAYGA